MLFAHLAERYDRWNGTKKPIDTYRKAIAMRPHHAAVIG